MGSGLTEAAELAFNESARARAVFETQIGSAACRNVESMVQRLAESLSSPVIDSMNAQMDTLAQIVSNPLWDAAAAISQPQWLGAIAGDNSLQDAMAALSAPLQRAMDDLQAVGEVGTARSRQPWDVDEFISSTVQREFLQMVAPAPANRLSARVEELELERDELLAENTRLRYELRELKRRQLFRELGDTSELTDSDLPPADSQF